MKYLYDPSSDELIASCAARTVDAIAHAWREGRRAQIVVTGGRTGSASAKAIDIALFRLIRNNESFEGCVVHIWFSDERYVSSDSDERNDKALIEGFSLSTAHCVFHVVDFAGSNPEQELDGAAANYARDMELEVGSKAFDSVVLSMGEDGHIASLFPGRIDPTEPRYAIGISGSPKPPALRVSISLSRLAHASAIYIFGLGEGKIGALEAVQSGPVGLLAANSKSAQVIIMTDQLVSGVKQ